MTKLLSQRGILEGVTPGGILYVRPVGPLAQLRIAYWTMKIALMLSIVVFHDSIISYIGAQLGRNIVPFITGLSGALRF